MFDIYYEDIVIDQAETFGAYEVTKDELISFASQYDPQPFHLNEEIAKQSVFGALCTSGWHTCAMTMRMMVDNMMVRKVAGMGSPGVDEIRWLKPVQVGDILSVTTRTISKRPSESRKHIGLIQNSITVNNQHGASVMTMVANVMLLRKNSGDRQA